MNLWDILLTAAVAAALGGALAAIIRSKGTPPCSGCCDRCSGGCRIASDSPQTTDGGLSPSPKEDGSAEE